MSAMYTGWSELRVCEEAQERSVSVLQKFPTASSGAVVHAVVQSLAQSLGLSSGQPEPSSLITDVEVNWCMEVMCYGLRLPLKEHEAIKNCVHVYCEWLVSLIPDQAKICVPRPVMLGANHYSRRILRHLYNLFSPRHQDLLTSDVVSRQAVLCHRVLRTVQNVATTSPIIEQETWQEILSFLLAINDTLLSDKQNKEDDAEGHLCERLLSVLFQVWMVACHRSFFPSPSFWKTLQCLCIRWRHRQILVDQWRKIQLIMTEKLAREILDSDYPSLRMEEGELVPPEMGGERLGQSWYRMLHTLGDLSQLARDTTPSNGTLTNNTHDAQENQSQIFYKAMASTSAMVDVWLGRFTEDNAYKLILPSAQGSLNSSMSSSTISHPGPSTPPSLRKTKPRTGQKLHITQLMTHKPQPSTSPAVTPTGPSPSMSVSSVATERSSVERFNTASHVLRRLTLHHNRPSVNSLLHLYGTWLFESAMMTLSDAESAFIDSETESIQSVSSTQPEPMNTSTKSVSDSESVCDPASVSAWSLEWGQAEAIGTLCKIFASKSSDEEVESVYLARYILALKQTLCAQAVLSSSNVIVSSVVANSADIFKCDLESAPLLIPCFVSAVETVLTPPQVRSYSGSLSTFPVNEHLLHNSAISILLSLLPYTLHSKLQVNDQTHTAVPLSSFRTRLIRLLLVTVGNETDSLNIQTALNGLMCVVLDQVEYEATSSGSSRDDTAASDDSAFHDTHLLFTAIKCICQNLNSAWKNDSAIVLTALEILTVFARVHVSRLDIQNHREYRQCVGWLCDLIVWQSHRPARDHSKELHSTIVAAFGCLTVWLVEHSALFCDQDTIHSVMEVVELGISGSKSQAKPTDMPQYKQNKERKPLSKRVLQAAEAVLSALMDHVGYFPNAAGPECPISSLLDEQALLKDRPGGHFRYFYTQNSALIGILEDPIHAPPTSNPSLTLLVRAPFGRHVWAMQLSNVPQSKLSLLSQGVVAHTRPSNLPPMVLTRYQMVLPTKEQMPAIMKRIPPYFPPKVNEIPPCDIEKSVIPDPWNMPDHTISKNLLSIVESQVKLEACCRREAAPENPSDKFCEPPQNRTSFQTARLFLLHFGFLNPNDETMKPAQSLLPLRSCDEFSSQLQQLDNLSARSADTVHVFYMKRRQTRAEDILENSRSSSKVHPLYLEFLRTLGWPVDVAMHIGWTGSVETSWKVSGDMDLNDLPSDHGGSLYDGTHQVLYWADVMSELAFVVPTVQDKRRASSVDSTRSESMEARTPPEKPPRSSMTLNFDKTKSSSRATSPMLFEVKVMVVWLENFEDHCAFPLEQLLPSTDSGIQNSQRASDVILIFIAPLQNGLFRLRVENKIANRESSIIVPSLDGLIVSRRTLGSVVRNIALNLCKRKRLDADPEICPAPHVKRRAKIQELGKKFSLDVPTSRFYTSLFERAQSGNS